MRLELTPEARLDILQARAWYEQRAPGLGAEFGRSVDAAVAAIQRFPLSAPRLHGEIRRAALRRFPYSLLYAVDERGVVIHGCFHQRRDPEPWG